jgi:hypothetical protein
MAKLLGAVAVVSVLCATLLAGVATANELNQPSYYEALGYGVCTKNDRPTDPFQLGAPPSGSSWTLLVLKAGSEKSNDDWNTLVHNPTPGAYSHPSGKKISHVIVCSKPGTPTTTTSTTTTVPGGECSEYTPTLVAVDPPSAQPGDLISITGVAVAGDTVTATLSGGAVLGQAVAGPTGQFAISAVVPDVAEGVYSIVVSSGSCPTSVTISLVVYPLTFSGCGFNSDARSFVPGQKVTWTLHDSSFDTKKPVRLALKASGYEAVLYGFAAWPGSNKVAVTIPPTAPTRQYFMEQTGTIKSGKTETKTCPVWVGRPPKRASVSVDSDGMPLNGNGLPVTAVIVGAITLSALVRLRFRRS